MRLSIKYGVRSRLIALNIVGDGRVEGMRRVLEGKAEGSRACLGGGLGQDFKMWLSGREKFWLS